MTSADDRAHNPPGPGAGPALGVDLGTRRIGIAVTDSRRVLARPLVVVERSGDPVADRRAIAALVEEHEATTVVVGLPLSMSGQAGPAAVAASREAAALADELSVPVVFQDERLTTVEATRRLREHNGHSRSPATRKRVIVDDHAAAILLQAFIDNVARS